MHRPARLLKRSLTASAVLAAAVLPALPTRAANTLTWDTDINQAGAQGGSGTWIDGGLGWLNGSTSEFWNNANFDTAVFTGNPGTVTISGTAAASFLKMESSGYTLTGGRLVFGNSGSGIFCGIYVDSTSATIASEVRAGNTANAWTKQGVGTLTLTGNNFASTDTRLILEQGAVAIADKFNLVPNVYINGNINCRLLFTATGQAEIASTLGISTKGYLDVQNAAARIDYTGDISGTGAFFKEGAGTLVLSHANTAFNHTVTINAGTLELHDALGVNSRAIQLNAGALSLQADTPTAFGSVFSPRPTAGNTVTLALGGAPTTTGAHSLPAITHITGTLNVTSSNNWGLTVPSITNAGTIDLNNTRLTITSALTPFAGQTNAGTLRFAHDPSPTPNTATRGLWFNTGTATTLTAILDAQTNDADLLVGSQPNGGVATNLTLDGAWRGGGGTAGASAVTSTLVLPPSGNITFGPNLRFNNLPTDPAAAPRPVRAWGTSSTQGGTLTFDPAFVADHTSNGATPDGLASLALSNVPWETQNSQSLPVVTRTLPGSSATYRTGLITFDNFSNPSAVNRWTVKTNDQTYDGGVWVKANTTFVLQKSLTHTGRVGPYADNAFQLAANRTLTLTNGHTLTLSGDLGFAPGSRITGGDALVVFDTDPGAGWYDGNYTRNPSTGAVTTPPAPAHTLTLSVGINQSPGGAIFNAPVTRLAELAVAGTTVASLSLPGPQKVLSVANRLSFGTASVAQLDLTNNAMILGANANHTPATVRAMLTAGALRSSAADADHALGYARAADVLPTPAPGQPYTFLTLPVAPDDVLVRYTLLGDATLDGVVNFTDLLTLARNYNTTTTAQWSTGDFNYDNTVNFTDLLALARHYNAALPSAAIPGAPAEFAADLSDAFAAAAVPEPSALTLVAACGFTATRCRRRPRCRPTPA